MTKKKFVALVVTVIFAVGSLLRFMLMPPIPSDIPIIPQILRSPFREAEK